MIRQRAHGAVLMALGVLAAATMLRAPITAVPPSLAAISTDLSLSATAAGATTSLPLVCFGVFAFLAPLLITRFGLERTMLLLLVPLLVGTVARSAGGAAAFFAGAVFVGVGIAIGNVLLPALIRARFPGRVALMMGLYVSVLQLSGAVGSVVTVPLEQGLGWGWRSALLIWALPVALLLALWFVIARRRPRDPAARPPAGLRHVARRRMAWAITVFMGLQAGIFYTMLTWIPAHLTAHGISTAAAGLVLGLYSLLGLPGAFIAPHFATGPHARVFIGVVYGLQVVAMILFGLGAAPAIAAALIAGTCQGAGFSVALTFIADQPDPHDVPAISAMAQGLGYLAAAAGPAGIGALFSATGDWLWPDAVVAAAAALLVVLGGSIGSRIHASRHLERLRR